MSLLKKFLLVTLSIIITRFFKFIIENELNEDNFDIKFINNTLNKKKSTLILKIFKKKNDLKTRFYRHL